MAEKEITQKERKKLTAREVHFLPFKRVADSPWNSLTHPPEVSAQENTATEHASAEQARLSALLGGDIIGEAIATVVEQAQPEVAAKGSWEGTAKGRGRCLEDQLYWNRLQHV